MHHLIKILSSRMMIYVFRVLHHIYTSYIVMGSWKGGGNQYIQLVKDL